MMAIVYGSIPVFLRLLLLALAVEDAHSSTAGIQNYIAKGCKQTCTQLSLEFGQALHFGHDDPSFSIWDSKQQEVRHACRIEPVSSAQVARVMELVVKNCCRFAIKGGGHSTNLDASNSIGGVTVDLNRMNHIEVSNDRSWANLGPGLVLSEAYTFLERYNLTNIGGRVADVGLSGFTLGDGISNLSPQYGLALDDVLEYEVVLPNTTVVNVTEHTHPDLYFALRGGGNNFGIVTNFRTKLVPQGQMLGGEKIYHADYTDQLVDQVYRLTTVLAEDTFMCFTSRYFYDQTKDRFLMSMTPSYYEPVLEPSVFAALNRIPSESSTIRIDWMSNFALEAVTPHGYRRLYATLTFHPSRVVHRRLLNIFTEEVERVKQTRGLTTSVVVSSLHKNAIKTMKVRGGNCLGVVSDEALNIGLLTIGWLNAEDDDVMNTFADRWLQRAQELAADMGLLNRWLYINYAKYDQDPFLGYGELNRLKLRNIQKVIDQEGVFTSQGLCQGSFKLL